MRDACSVTDAPYVTDFEMLGIVATLGASCAASAIGPAHAPGARVSRGQRSLDVLGTQPDIELADDELDDVARLQAAQTREHLTNQASLGIGVIRGSKVVGPPGYATHRDPAR